MAAKGQHLRRIGCRAAALRCGAPAARADDRAGARAVPARAAVDGRSFFGLVFGRSRADYAPVERAGRFLARAARPARSMMRRRHHRPGARRFDGGLARLRARRCAWRFARARRRAQAPYRIRAGPLRHPQRDAGLGAGGARGDRGGEAEVHRHDGRLERPPGDPRAPAAGRRPGVAGRSPAPPLAHRRQARARRPATPPRCDDPRPSSHRALRPTAARPPGLPHLRIPHRGLGGALCQAHRRHDRRAQAAPACRCSGSACRRSAGRNRRARCSISTICIRSRAEKAGAIYIDVWDGFVDESGRFVVQGPDFEGQIRRLRVSDGVHFTKAGARKLAHYRRARNPPRGHARLGPIALPTTEPQPPAAGAPGRARPRRGRWPAR